MRQCEQVDKINEKSERRNRGEIIKEQNTNLQSSIFPKSPLSLLNGIIPGEFHKNFFEKIFYKKKTFSSGTKWCGTGDIADTYGDLGDETTMDRCCRAHDLCPVKIRAYQNKYELINESLYTKWVDVDFDICKSVVLISWESIIISAVRLRGKARRWSECLISLESRKRSFELGRNFVIRTRARYSFSQAS